MVYLFYKYLYPCISTGKSPSYEYSQQRTFQKLLKWLSPYREQNT